MKPLISSGYGFPPKSPSVLGRNFSTGPLPLLWLLGWVLATFTAEAAPPELATQGNQIVVKSTGQLVRLTGVNIPSLEWGNGEHLKTTDAHGGSITVATAVWKANIIRLPIDPVRFMAGGAYVTTVDTVIAQAAAANCYVLLDNHEYGHPIPSHVTFWTNAATRYKNNPAVIFGLLNEPHGTTWTVWRDGDAVNPGMQDLVDTVRATGANNLVTASGLDYAYDLTGIHSGYALTDTATGNGIVYETHIYPWKTQWQWKVGTTSHTYPVIVGEIGHPDGTTFIGLTFEDDSTWVPRVLDYVDTHRLHYTGWCMHTGADPSMLLDWNYTPTPYWGAPAKARLAAYADDTVERIIGGTVIGTTGIRLAPANGILTHSQQGAVVPFGGNTSYYYDAAAASGCWTGLDLGTTHRITKIMFYPRVNNGALMVGGVFQGSNNPTFASGVVTLHTVATAPAATGGTLTTATISDTGSYRYVRYLGPANSYCNVTQIKFYGKPVAAAPSIYECENLTTAVSAGDSQSDWNDANCSGGKFNNPVLNAAGDFVQYTVNIAAAGTYQVYAKNKNYNNRGIYKLQVNGVDCGSPVDQYTSAITYSESYHGQVIISTPGNYTFKFVITGKNAASSSYGLGLDCIKLQP